jgi:hypothetical protein
MENLNIIENKLEAALLQESFSTLLIGELLLEIKEHKLFTPDFDSLVSYALARFNLGRASVYNYIATTRVSGTLCILPIHKRLVSVSALTKLATFPIDDRQGLWDNFVSLEKPTISGLMEICNVGSIVSKNEYYTPPELVRIMKQMNEGDPFSLDPCSCYTANNLHDGLLAQEILTMEEDGLSREWSGDVFVNPPYGTIEARQSSREIG